MIKTIKTMSKQEKERYTVPRKVQDVIPVRRIWPDGIFLVGNKFSIARMIWDCPSCERQRRICSRYVKFRNSEAHIRR